MSNLAYNAFESGKASVEQADTGRSKPFVVSKGGSDRRDPVSQILDVELLQGGNASLGEESQMV